MIQEQMIQESREKARRIWILALVPLAAFMVAIDATVVATALSTIRRDLGTSIEELEWIVNAYNLSFAVLLIMAAALGDRFGRRRMFVAGLGLFVAASAACAFSRDVVWLIVARAIQGSGAALEKGVRAGARGPLDHCVDRQGAHQGTAPARPAPVAVVIKGYRDRSVDGCPVARTVEEHS